MIVLTATGFFVVALLVSLARSRIRAAAPEAAETFA
jgi:hypothetical protein